MLRSGGLPKLTVGQVEGLTEAMSTMASSIPAAQVQVDWTQSNATMIDFVKNKPANRSFNNSSPRTHVTVAAAANGVQLSATRDAFVSYSVQIVTTASIVGNASGYTVLEICPTNSAIAANWIEIGRVPNAQALSLAITLQSIQTSGGILSNIIPAGYFSRIRDVIVA